MRKVHLSYLVCLLLISSVLLTACSSGVSVSDSNSSSNSSSRAAVATTVKDSSSRAAVATTVKDSSSSNGAAKAGKKAGPASLYPNPNLTPGDVIPGVTAKQVCVPGYSSGVRDVTAAEKDAVYQEYGIPNVTGQHEVDHFISLELGGSNNIKNLWPEPYEPKPGAHEKDKVEDALHAEVCAGHLTLADAQRIISEDWYAYYQKITAGA